MWIFLPSRYVLIDWCFKPLFLKIISTAVIFRRQLPKFYIRDPSRGKGTLLELLDKIIKRGAKQAQADTVR